MMGPQSHDTAGMLMAVTQGVASWLAITPDLKNVQDAGPADPEFLADFRRTEITAGAITVGIGAVGSLIMKSIYPLLASVLIVVLLVTVYEWSFRATPPVEKTERVTQ